MADEPEMNRRNRSFDPSRRLGKRRQAGATLVEFAFVFMVLMTMIFGVVDFSRAFYAYHFVSNMARTASRWASVNGYTCANDTSTTDTGGSCNGTDGMHDGPVGPTNSADVQTWVQDHAPLGINPDKLTAITTWPVQTDSPAICSAPVLPDYLSSEPNYPGCTVQVKVSYQFNFLYPFVHTGAITLSSTSAMVIAH
jgi:TadE-like protein